MKVPPIVASLLYKFMQLWTTPVLRFRVSEDQALVEFMPKGAARQSIDERIQQIESARLSLVEALSAIDELRLAAEQNKVELAASLEALAATQTQSASAAKELEVVREIAKSDIGVFRRLAGIPSQGEIAQERFIGFLLGIAASVVASGLWWMFSRWWPLLKT